MSYGSGIIPEPEYSPEFIAEMQAIMKQPAIKIPDGMTLAEYIDSLPDEEE